jgi:hypothetical protein
MKASRVSEATKMGKRLKSQRRCYFVPATYRGPWPGDYPVGSPQSRAAARAILTAYAEEKRKEEEAALADLTPFERAHILATVEDVDKPLVRIWMIRLIRIALERGKVYEQPFPLKTPEEIRHRRAVIKEIDRLTDGKAWYLENNDGLEWNRLKAIAEENLRAKKK